MQYDILEMSYWEHRKYAEELARCLGADHPKYRKIEKELNKIIEQRNESLHKEKRKIH